MSAINRQIAKADKLARKHGRDFAVLSDLAITKLFIHDSAAPLHRTAAERSMVHAIVCPDGRMYCSGHVYPTDIIYPGERGRLANLAYHGLD